MPQYIKDDIQRRNLAESIKQKVLNKNNNHIIIVSFIILSIILFLIFYCIDLTGTGLDTEPTQPQTHLDSHECQQVWADDGDDDIEILIALKYKTITYV